MANSNLARRLNIPDKALSNIKFVSVDEGITRRKSVQALLLPNGKILISTAEGIAGSVYTLIARSLNAKAIVVHGTWTFTPDTTVDFEEVVED